MQELYDVTLISGIRFAISKIQAPAHVVDGEVVGEIILCPGNTNHDLELSTLNNLYFKLPSRREFKRSQYCSPSNMLQPSNHEVVTHKLEMRAHQDWGEVAWFDLMDACCLQFV